MTISNIQSAHDTYYSGTPISEATLNVATGAPTNGALVVMVSTLAGAADVVDVKWGGSTGTSLTKREQAGSDGSGANEFWVLLDWGGGTDDVWVDWDSNINGYHVVAIWMSSENALALGDFNTHVTDEDPTSISLTTTENGALVLGGYASRDNNVPTTTDTLLKEYDAGGNVSGVAYLLGGAAGVHTIDWDRSGVGQSSLFQQAAIELYEDVPGSAPTIVADTVDGALFNTGEPQLKFTGTDADLDDLRYQVQISDDLNFGSGDVLVDQHTTGV